MKGLSLRQVALQYDMNGQLIATLIDLGIFRVLPGCSPLRPRIDSNSVSNAIEGEHYIRCLECGAWLALITGKHLKMCSEILKDADGCATAIGNVVESIRNRETHYGI